ncbi:MAG: 5'-3' exonuclease H3TH domain-containing protein, partial [Bradymonadaceae bacterium]
MTDDADTLYLVDGSSYIFRAYYAVRGLTNSEGLPTNAAYGFTQMIQTLLEGQEPEYIAVALDAFGSDVPTFRHERYDEYKANRDDTPEDLMTQVPYIRRIIEALHIPLLEKPGVEADDLIATATRRAREEGVEVTIVSGDKDLMQLLGDGVTMYDTKGDNLYTPDEVEERFGVTPDKQRYVMAMAGDSSDNIPGVPGIGPKTGGKLIRKFGDLDGVYENLDKVGGKKRPKSLAEHEEQARLSLELVTLKEDCDIDFDLDDLRLTPPNVAELEEVFRELEFQDPLEDIEQWLRDRGWIDAEQLQLQLGPGTFEETGEEMPDKDYRGVFTEEELDEVLEACREAERFGFDLETTSLDSLEAEIVGFAFAWAPHEAVYVPVGHTNADREQLDRDLVVEKVRPLLEDEESNKVLQHWKYEWIVLKSYDIELAGVAYDTMLMSYLLEPGRNSHSLDDLVREYLEYETITYGDVAGTGNDQVRFDEVGVSEAIPYAAEDADVTLLLCEAMADQLDDKGLRELHDDIEIPISRVLGIMERTGIRVD